MILLSTLISEFMNNSAAGTLDFKVVNLTNEGIIQAKKFFLLSKTIKNDGLIKGEFLCMPNIESYEGCGNIEAKIAIIPANMKKALEDNDIDLMITIDPKTDDWDDEDCISFFKQWQIDYHYEL